MPTKSDLPSFETYFVPTVECLKARGGSMTIGEMEDDVAEAMALSDELLAERWSRFLRQGVKVDSMTRRIIHHEDAETVFG